ncbi:MAG: hypothetical protein A2931_03335 [Candidatus Niyogibacteria bacterium RIFCSPLOWO2_01_FULL_45_48]|uniref:Uncharacterized protein n=1 Tax=Candidatus Niyogibacteria bacterium RIFCSPLOWO2_01_FULL_45_48 TaxID=1801724 RepID=A0A1G2EUA4_9BACT|nr:MAG: hypothetical protein A2931_03335 [Candidatus Niyogibacteria bacterium RIFCSPLOWO2_01_FULL_45_48]
MFYPVRLWLKNARRIIFLVAHREEVQLLVHPDNIGMCHRAAEPAIARQPRLLIVRPANGGIARLILVNQLLLLQLVPLASI